MKFKTHEDIQATMEQVFLAASDFDRIEHSAMRHGAHVKRTDALDTRQVGMTWHAEFRFRKRKRTADIELKKLDAPNALEVHATISGLMITLNMDLLALSKRRTRMAISVDIRPQNIMARLLLQSMKIARTSIVRRFRKRVSDYAVIIEERFEDKEA